MIRRDERADRSPHGMLYSRFHTKFLSPPRTLLSIMNRITVDPKQMNGVPCIRGLRIPVATVIGMVAEGMTPVEILRDFPDLEAEDVHAALVYAAEAVRERELPLLHAS